MALQSNNNQTVHANRSESESESKRNRDKHIEIAFTDMVVGGGVDDILQKRSLFGCV